MGRISPRSTRGPCKTIDGISNVGSDIDFVSGAGMNIVPNDNANTITFISSGSGNGGGSDTLDDVCERGATTDQAITVTSSGSVFNSLKIDNNLHVYNDTIINNDLLIDGNVGIGTTTIPHGGRGYSKLALDGPTGSENGPHVQYTVSFNDHPVFQQLNWNHDDIWMFFDSYYDGSFRSSDAGSNFALNKSSDAFKIKYGSGVGAGAVVSLNTGFEMSNTGEIYMPGNVGIGTAAPTTELEVNGTIKTTHINVTETIFSSAGHVIINDYTKLGIDAPAIKTKKLTGTTAATEGGFTAVAHGLTSSKILPGTAVEIEYLPGLYMPTECTIGPGYRAHITRQAGAIRVWNHSTDSENILSKPFVILITYEE